MTDDLDSLNTSRRIELVPVSQLKGDPKNPKSHSLADIDDSYQRFGVVDIITVDGRTGYILSGHGRATVLANAYTQGEPAPEGITIDPATNEWLVPVVSGWASKNDAEAAAALISMNRLTELGGWADDALLDLLDEISASGASFDGVGFSETDQEDLRALVENLPDLTSDKDGDDPKPVAGSGGAKAVTIKLTDAGLIDWWHSIRDTYKTDNEAVASLAMDLGATEIADAAFAAEAAKPEKPTRGKKAAKTGSNQIAEPTLANLADDDDEVAEVMHNVHSVVENPEDDDLPDADPDE